MTPALFIAITISMTFAGALFYIDVPFDVALPAVVCVSYTGGMLAAKYDNGRRA